MAIASELNNKRLEVKREIDAGIDTTPMSILFNTTSRVFQKVVRSPKPYPFISCVAFLALTIFLLLALDFLVLFRATAAATGISLLSVIIVLEVGFLTVVLTYFNINRVLTGIRDTLVDFIVSPNDLSNLYRWLSFGWLPGIIKSYLVLWIVILTGGEVLIGAFAWLKGISIFGLLIPYLLFMVLGGIGWYYVPLMVSLPLRLRLYQFKLYESNPARSEVIEDISTILNHYVYGYVLINSLFQLSLTTLKLPILVQLGFMIIVGWIPVIIQYLVNQGCIRSIIYRSKRKTLNRIQAEVQILHEGDIQNKENIEKINRLIDYHERIRLTPNSAVNIQSLSNFLNQLALPLLGFLLANISTIVDLFR